MGSGSVIENKFDNIIGGSNRHGVTGLIRNILNSVSVRVTECGH